MDFKYTIMGLMDDGTIDVRLSCAQLPAEQWRFLMELPIVNDQYLTGANLTNAVVAAAPIKYIQAKLATNSADLVGLIGSQATITIANNSTLAMRISGNGMPTNHNCSNSFPNQVSIKADKGNAKRKPPCANHLPKAYSWLIRGNNQRYKSKAKNNAPQITSACSIKTNFVQPLLLIWSKKSVIKLACQGKSIIA